MNWTKKQPTEPGYYWLHHEENNIKYTRIVQVVHGGKYFVPGKSISYPVGCADGLWFGPVTPEMCGA